MAYISRSHRTGGMSSYYTRYSRKNRPQNPDINYNVRYAPVYKPKDADDFDNFLVTWCNSVSTKLSASYINSIINGADGGNPTLQADLYRNIQERDAVIAAHIQTRKSAVTSLNWNIVGDEEAHRVGIEKVLEQAKIHKLISHLMDAVPTGYAGAAIDWGRGGSSIKGFKLVAPDRWQFDQAGNPAIELINGTLKGINEYHKYAFVFQASTPKPGSPAMGGLMRPLTWIYFFKNYAIKYKTRFLEKFGIPFVVGKISDADFDDDVKRAAKKTELAQMGADGVAVTTKDADIQFPATPAQGNNANFIEWIDWLDKSSALVILGQIASSGPTGGMSDGQMQENVRTDLMIGDANMLEETINEQIIKPLEWYKYKTNDISFRFETDPPEDITKKIEMVKALESMGKKVTDEWIEKNFGVAVETTKGKSMVGGSANVPQGLENPGDQPTTPNPLAATMPEAMPTELPGAPPELSDITVKKKVIAFKDQNYDIASRIYELSNQNNLPKEVTEAILSSKPNTFYAKASKAISDHPGYAGPIQWIRNAIAQEIAEQPEVTEEPSEFEYESPRTEGSVTTKTVKEEGEESVIEPEKLTVPYQNIVDALEEKPLKPIFTEKYIPPERENPVEGVYRIAENAIKYVGVMPELYEESVRKIKDISKYTKKSEDFISLPDEEKKSFDNMINDTIKSITKSASGELYVDSLDSIKEIKRKADTLTPIFLHITPAMEKAKETVKNKMAQLDQIKSKYYEKGLELDESIPQDSKEYQVKKNEIAQTTQSEIDTFINGLTEEEMFIISGEKLSLDEEEQMVGLKERAFLASKKKDPDRFKDVIDSLNKWEQNVLNAGEVAFKNNKDAIKFRKAINDRRDFLYQMKDKKDIQPEDLEIGEEMSRTAERYYKSGWRKNIGSLVGMAGHIIGSDELRKWGDEVAIGAEEIGRTEGLIQSLESEVNPGGWNNLAISSVNGGLQIAEMFLPTTIVKGLGTVGKALSFAKGVQKANNISKVARIGKFINNIIPETSGWAYKALQATPKVGKYLPNANYGQIKDFGLFVSLMAPKTAGENIYEEVNYLKGRNKINEKLGIPLLTEDEIYSKALGPATFKTAVDITTELIPWHGFGKKATKQIQRQLTNIIKREVGAKLRQRGLSMIGLLGKGLKRGAIAEASEVAEEAVGDIAKEGYNWATREESLFKKLSGQSGLKEEDIKDFINYMKNQVAAAMASFGIGAGTGYMEFRQETIANRDKLYKNPVSSLKRFGITDKDLASTTAKATISALDGDVDSFTQEQNALATMATDKTADPELRQQAMTGLSIAENTMNFHNASLKVGGIMYATSEADKKLLRDKIKEGTDQLYSLPENETTDAQKNELKIIYDKDGNITDEGLIYIQNMQPLLFPTLKGKQVNVDAGQEFLANETLQRYKNTHNGFNQKDTEVVFVRNKDIGTDVKGYAQKRTANAWVVTAKNKGDKNKIFINLDVVRPEQIMGILRHEDFTHIIFDNLVTDKQRAMMDGIFDKYVSGSDISNLYLKYWNRGKTLGLNAKNSDTYAKNEILAKFIESPAFEKLTERGGIIGNAIDNISKWIKSVAGKTTEYDEALDVLITMYKSYQKNKLPQAQRKNFLPKYMSSEQAIKAVKEISRAEDIDVKEGLIETIEVPEGERLIQTIEVPESEGVKAPEQYSLAEDLKIDKDYISKVVGKENLNNPSSIALHNAKVEILNKLWENNYLNEDLLIAIRNLSADNLDDSNIEEALRSTGDKRYLSEIYEGQYNEDLSKDDVVDFDVSDNIFDWAIASKGTTDDINEAGYVLPDGTMLDFSGKRYGGSPGERAEDHRQLPIPVRGDISGTDLMRSFMKSGAIRIDANAKSVDIATKPTLSQISKIKEVLSDDEGYVDLADGERRGYIEVGSVDDAIRKIKEFYNRSDSTAKFSLPEDTKYLELAKEPEKNKEELQKMVDERAVSTGYDSPVVYNGMSYNPGNIFKKGLANTIIRIEGLDENNFGFFFTESKEQAGHYAGSKGVIKQSYLRMKNPLDLSRYDGIAESDDIQAFLYESKVDFDIDTGMEDTEVWRHFLDNDKPLADAIQKAGYDGIIFNEPYGYVDKKAYVVFESNQIKSADPVTYDDNGNVIPLSKRFQPEQEDIRYSLAQQETSMPKKNLLYLDYFNAQNLRAIKNLNDPLALGFTGERAREIIQKRLSVLLEQNKKFTKDIENMPADLTGTEKTLHDLLERQIEKNNVRMRKMVDLAKTELTPESFEAMAKERIDELEQDNFEIAKQIENLVKEYPETKEIVEEVTGVEKGTVPTETINLRQFYNLLSKGARVGARNVLKYQKMANDYLKENKVPPHIQKQLIPAINNLASPASDAIKQRELDVIFDRVEKEVDLYNKRVAKYDLIKSLKKLKKFGVDKLSPDLKNLALSTEERFRITKPSEKTVKSLKASMEYFNNPSGDRATLLKELNLKDSELKDRELAKLVSAQRKENLPPALLNEMAELDKVPASEMSIEEIKTLQTTFEGILHQQKLMNEIREGRAKRFVKNRYDESVEIIKDTPEGRFIAPIPIPKYIKELFPSMKNDPEKIKRVRDLFRKSNLPPRAIAEFLDGFLDKQGPFYKTFVGDFRDGDDKRTEVLQKVFYATEAIKGDPKSPTHIDDTNWASDKDEHKISYRDSKGKEFKINKMERISLYLHSLNQNNLNHLLGDGFVTSNDPKNLHPYKLNKEILNEILADMSEEEIRYANGLSNIFDNILAPAINETSLKLNGYKMAEVSKYFTIPTSGLHSRYGGEMDTLTPEDLEATANFDNFAIEGLGFLKKRQAGAKNAIVLENAITTLNKSAKLASIYHGKAEPLRNATYFINGAGGKNVLDSIISKHKGIGPFYWEALKQIVEDQQRGEFKKQSVVAPAVHLLVKGQLGYNVPVWFMQLPSFITAMNEIPVKHWVTGALSLGETYEKMSKYSPFLWDRSMGNISASVADVMKERAKGAKGFRGMRWFDLQAIGRIWKSIESQVKEESPELSGDDFWKEVARRTSDIVRDTQPISSMTDRAEIARAKDATSLFVSMYQAQRSQNYGINYINDQRMGRRLKDGTATKEEVARWAKGTLINRIIVPTLITAIRRVGWGVLFAALVKLGIRISPKEEDESWGEWAITLSKEFAGTTLGDMGMLMGLIGGMVQGYSPTHPLASVSKKVIGIGKDSWKLLWQLANDERYKKTDKKGRWREGEAKWHKTAKSLVWDLIQTMGMFGPPSMSGKQNLIEAGAILINGLDELTPDIVKEKVNDLFKKEKTEEEKMKWKQSLEKFERSLLSDLESEYNSENKIVAMAETRGLSPSTVKLANEIITMQNAITKMGKQSKIKKGVIAPEVRSQPVTTSKGTVTYVEGSVAMTIDKRKLRFALKTILGLPDDKVDEILRSSQIPKEIRPYIKAIPFHKTEIIKTNKKV